MKSKRRGFDVHINEEFAEEFAQEFAGGAGASIDEFAQSFAGWQASPTKEFDTKDIQKLLDAIDHNPAATFRIVGYNEFPYRAKIEREYWLKVGNVNQGCSTSPCPVLSRMPSPTWQPRQSALPALASSQRGAEENTSSEAWCTAMQGGGERPDGHPPRPLRWEVDPEAKPTRPFRRHADEPAAFSAGAWEHPPGQHVVSQVR